MKAHATQQPGAKHLAEAPPLQAEAPPSQAEAPPSHASMAEFDLFNVGDQRSGQVDPHHLSEREVQVNYRLL